MKVETLIAFIDAITDNPEKTKDKVREKLARMEITARTQKKRQNKDIEPTNIDDLTNRYEKNTNHFSLNYYLMLLVEGRQILMILN